MARKISRGFRSGVILKFRRIFRDKADQAPIFLRVEGFARHGSCGRRCFFRSLQFLRAQSGENERKANDLNRAGKNNDIFRPQLTGRFLANKWT